MLRIILFFVAMAFSSSLMLGEEDLSYAERKKRALEAADSTVPTSEYVHKNLDFPRLSGIDLRGEPLVVRPRKGNLLVLFFLASWCQPCQEQLIRMQAIQKKHRYQVDYWYIFTHDTPGEARAFAKKTGIKQGLIGNKSILKNFKNPKLPTIFIADKEGWIGHRIEEPQKEQMQSLDEYIGNLTRF